MCRTSRHGRSDSKPDLLQGTLDMLILQVVAPGPLHGYAVGQRLQQITRDALQVQQGSLYPALHRLEERGWLRAEWGPSETGRDAKFYSLTSDRPQTAGRRAAQLGADRGGDRAGVAHGGVRAGGTGLDRCLWSMAHGQWLMARLAINHQPSAISSASADRERLSRGQTISHSMRADMRWFRTWFRRNRLDRDLARELDTHLDLHVHHLIAGGVSRSDARRRARLELGGVDQVTEQVRDARAGAWLDSAVHDARDAFRGLKRTPGSP